MANNGCSARAQRQVRAATACTTTAYLYCACANSFSFRSFGSCTSLSDWLVTVTSGLARISCASAAVLPAHMSTMMPSKLEGAL
eukprot:scaffold128704_cov63-Phaeocystis_antarctica.AAC.2